MRKPIDIVVLEEEKVNELKPMIFEYLKNGYELVGQIQYSPENAYRCDTYVATMIKYEQCEQIEDNKMRTAKDIDYKIKDMKLTLKQRDIELHDGYCSKENYDKDCIELNHFIKALKWVRGEEL